MPGMSDLSEGVQNNLKFFFVSPAPSHETSTLAKLARVSNLLILIGPRFGPSVGEWFREIRHLVK